MSNYQARIRSTPDDAYYAYIVRVDNDGQEYVDNVYKGRHFGSRKAAEKSTNAYLAKLAKEI